MDNSCDARGTCTDHGVTQYVGGLAQFVLRDPTVEQDGLQQAGVVQVNVVVSLLHSRQHTQTHFGPTRLQLLSKAGGLLYLYEERLGE